VTSPPKIDPTVISAVQPRYVCSSCNTKGIACHPVISVSNVRKCPAALAFLFTQCVSMLYTAPGTVWLGAIGTAVMTQGFDTAPLSHALTDHENRSFDSSVRSFDPGPVDDAPCCKSWSLNIGFHTCRDSPETPRLPTPPIFVTVACNAGIGPKIGRLPVSKTKNLDKMFT
jgi:hypothetical protein